MESRSSFRIPNNPMKPNHLLHHLFLCALLLGQLSSTSHAAAPPPSVIDNLSFSGQADPDQASFILKGRLKGTSPEEQEPKLIYSLQSDARIQVDPTNLTQNCELRARIFQGKMKELVLALRGEGEVTQLTGPLLKDWSVRFGAKEQRFLVIRPQDPATNTVLTNFAVTVSTRQAYDKLPRTLSPLSFTPENAAFFDGSIEVAYHSSVDLSATNLGGLLPIKSDSSDPSDLSDHKPLRFRFSAPDYTLALQVRERDPDARRIAWENFKLLGELHDQHASFVLTGEAVVKHPQGGTLAVLSGDAAMTSVPAGAELKYDQGRYWLHFPKAGVYPLELKFNARVASQDGWNSLNFEVVPSSLRPVILQGLSADTQFQFSGAAKPERQKDEFVSYLPSAGKLQLQWKEAKTEELGKLFFAVQGTEQIAVGPGLLRQAHLMEYKVMQGELSQLVFDLSGDGEVTRIRGDDILAWKIEGPNPDQTRRLIVQLNQPHKDRYSLLIQTQTPLGVFPLRVQPLRLVPTQAIRFGGHVLAINDGAVRLEVTDARGLSQISPDLFPQSKELAELAAAQRSQAFAYRFSGGDYALSIQAENILPELSVSQVLLYHLGETETAIEAEIELDIREAPLREFSLRVPADFTVSRLNVGQLSDYGLTPETEAGWARLKMLFATPLTGRQVIQLRLEKNLNAVAGPWPLPVLQPQNVKSVRGYVGVSAETGFRLTPGTVAGLTDIASAYFPKKIAGLQAAWRLRDETWQAQLTVERLALSVQADAVHLFTVSEGIAYGSSVINYLISGTPISLLKIAVPAEYGNVEFAGRDVRNWKKTDTNYEVYLQAPVFGTYTLLATFDRQFSAQSNSLSFVGIRPLDAQSEQGSVMVVSESQFEIKSAEVSPGLIQLDPGEIPPEHRLLFDAPILAAYQYSARPFSLQFALRSLGQGETVHQVVDRASLKTHVSREGEVVTEARYFVKSQGHSHLRLSVPAEAQLWEAKVNGNKVVPVADKQQTLIPLPANTDASAVLTVDLKLAAKSPEKKSVHLGAPVLAVPVLLTEWTVAPDDEYRLKFRQGTVAPAVMPDNSGFAWLAQLFHGEFGDRWQKSLPIAAGLLFIGALLLRLTTREGTYFGSKNHLLGAGFGLLFCGVAFALLASLMFFASSHPLAVPSGFGLVAPIQEPGQVLGIDVKNLQLEKLPWLSWTAWPALVGLALWIYLAAKVKPGAVRSAGGILGWALVCWAGLRVSDGAPVFLGAILVFVLLNLLAPALRRQWELPRQPKTSAGPSAQIAPGAATTLLFLGLLAGTAAPVSHAAPSGEPAKSTVQSVVQQARVHDNSVILNATIKWKTEAGQHLDFLSAPAVLIKIDYPQAALQLSARDLNGQSINRLVAKEAGQFDISFQYQLAIQKDNGSNSFVLPTPFGLVNRLDLEIEKVEADVYSPEAVSIQSSRAKRQDLEISRAELVLAPVTSARIGWKPRGRDTRTEKAVYYGELYHLFIPTAGVVEGVHEVQVRPAQGQLAEVTFQIPPALTITDVQTDLVSSWRFDPDQRLLRVQLTSAQARPFALRLRSQLATSPLPYQQTNGVITLVQAAGQVGMVALATGSEVQLDSAMEEGLSAINLEDFPSALVAEMARQIPGLTLRRAFRYAESTARVILAASAVQADVRVETQEVLSLGEDRTVLASQLTVQIARAGIFKLSFALPTDFEVESLTGPALSHWTELKADDSRIITLHLRGKTEGAQSFSITLTGPGTGNRKDWEAPRLVFREANKQTGQLLIAPELGMRLHAKTREGLTQLDPQKAGVQQKGVLAFRLLHPAWRFTFDIETVEPWIQVASLQDVTVREGQVLVTAHFDYQIENAGIRSFLIQLPALAENVHFEGDLISDSVRGASGTNRLADWEVKLQRRVIGNYSLRLSYQLAVTNQPAGLTVAGVKAKNANLQRGYLAVRASGRLQIQVPQLPASLQRTEWQSIPASLRRSRDLAESKDTFSTLETDFELPLTLSRHEVAKVLPARVEKIDLTSVVAPAGEMLTEGRLFLRPGDKRLLHLKLPATGQFWYAFINGQSALPWREGDEILLLLEKNSDPAKPTMVEFFYTCETGNRGGGFNHQLLGPSFDLPLENITWQVFVPENWRVKDWESSLQLRSEVTAAPPTILSLDTYLRTEAARKQEKSKDAETMLLMGNDFLQKGVPQQARRAYQAAWKLSPQDAAFNEDARVQLHNLKMQQALLGLNQRRQAAFDTERPLAGAGKSPRSPFSRWAPGQSPDYTQQQAEQVLEQNGAEDNAALMRLAERLIRQQDAGIGKPEAIRATLPAQGKQLTFNGSLQVVSGADLRIKLDATPRSPSQWAARSVTLLAIFIGLSMLALLIRGPVQRSPAR